MSSKIIINAVLDSKWLSLKDEPLYNANAVLVSQIERERKAQGDKIQLLCQTNIIIAYLNE